MPALGEADDLERNPAIHHFRLPNGLLCVLQPHPHPPGEVSVRLLVSVGSRFELEVEQGLAHYLEHLAFNGSTHFPDGSLTPRLQERGIGFGSHSNAHTGFDETVYKLDLPEVDDELLDIGLRSMADFLGELSLTKEAVDAERGVIFSRDA